MDCQPTSDSYIEFGAGFFDSYRKEVIILKVYILSKCPYCDGEAYLLIEKCQDSKGKYYIRYAPSPACEGSGNQPKWIDLADFAKLMQQAVCAHEHTSFHSNMHFSDGDTWDEIHEVCNDCGVNLDRLTLDDYINDEN